jgi:predicted outer membrane repeat protein
VGGVELELAGTTALTNNYAFQGGAVYVDAGMARCGTTLDDAASITSNTSDDPNTGAGVFLHGALADFNLLQCDMGPSGDPTDNMSGGYVNQDVTTDAGTFGFGTSAADTCNGALGCGPT